MIGKTGKVVSIDGNGDAKVNFGATTWTLNPQCCIPVSQGQAQAVPAARASLAVNTQSSDDDDDDDDENSQ